MNSLLMHGSLAHSSLAHSSLMPCTQSVASLPPIVLLHGWGNNSSTWAPVLEQLRAYAPVYLVDLPGFSSESHNDNQCPSLDLDALLKQLAEILPDKFVLLGWSLGGMIATRFAARFPQKVVALITLATNLSFSQRPDWPLAMPVETFDQFRALFVSNPDQCLKRFWALVSQGDKQERRVLKQLRASGVGLSDENKGAWLQALDLLNWIDNRKVISELTVPGLHLFGERDGLVPVAVAEKIEALNPAQQAEILPSACHALHWSDGNSLSRSIINFIEASQRSLDKAQVARSFSKAAASYDSVAILQRDVGQHLLTKVSPQDQGNTQQTVIDLGCGTGYFSPYLREKFPDANLVGVDIAEGMLVYAREHRPINASWLGGDAEALPLADQSVDVIFTSLAIQWCERPSILFAEIKRVLKPGGRCYCATLGPDTLFELKAAWRAVDKDVHVNRFLESAIIKASVEQAGLKMLEWQEQARVLFYPELKNLTHELKALGAHNVNQGKPGGLTGRTRVKNFRQAYEQFRERQGLPASYEVYYGVVEA